MTEAELRTFFDAYSASFLQTEVEVAEFFCTPCITARNGKVQLSATRQDVHAFWAHVLHYYREMGATQGEMRSFSWVPLGANSVAATIAWSYKNVAGEQLWASTFTYNLFKTADGWKILMQTMHDSA